MQKPKKLVLYVRIDEKNKKFIEAHSKKLGFACLSEYLNNHFGNMRTRQEKAQRKKRVLKRNIKGAKNA